jgi:hypothetical protein
VPRPQNVTDKIRGIWAEQIRGTDGAAIWK